MEDYISEENVVKNEIYNAFKEEIICPLCLNILIEPQMCMNCQNVYCKKCADEWSKKNEKCPNRCENPNYKKSLEKSKTLSKLKFKCNKCGGLISYEEMPKHIEICGPEKKIREKRDNVVSKKRIKKLDKDEVAKATKDGKLPRITCKIILQLILFLIK